MTDLDPDAVSAAPDDDPIRLEMWARFPLATTLMLRERFRQYREKEQDHNG